MVPPIALGAWSMALVLWQPPEYYYYYQAKSWMVGKNAEGDQRSFLSSYFCKQVLYDVYSYVLFAIVVMRAVYKII